MRVLESRGNCCLSSQLLAMGHTSKVEAKNMCFGFNQTWVQSMTFLLTYLNNLEQIGLSLSSSVK